MNYSQSLEYLLSFADFERSGRFQDRPDVAPVLALLRQLGDPHLGRRTVHITGSKGKGSVAAMVESCLRAAGYSTGLFTSPHLHSYTERVRLNGEPIPEAVWARLTDTLREAVDAVTPTLSDRRFVTFDLLIALAFLAFRERDVDVQVLEVGLGGRVDSTNVFGPTEKDVCAFTAVGLEHTDILGDTVEAIAAEKAGIVTPGATVVIGPQSHPAARGVIAKAAAEAACPVVDVAQRYSWRYLAHDLHAQTFELEGPDGAIRLTIPLLGRHQMENAATAVACLRALAERGVDIPLEAIENGLARVSWPGRLEVLRERPLVIADGAHSPESAAVLKGSLTDYFSCSSAFLIIGMLAGKDASAFARELAPVARAVVTVAAGHPRAMPPEQVAIAFEEAGVQTKIGGSVGDTLEEVLAKTDSGEVICVTGSLLVAAEARARLLGIATTA
ncbi:MAG: folylpolyglutamate synthase/dihydrofolate synthase family protein [Dehalococcoidia bacterium]